jgi:hypothetical protein
MLQGLTQLPLIYIYFGDFKCLKPPFGKRLNLAEEMALVFNYYPLPQLVVIKRLNN